MIKLKPEQSQDLVTTINIYRSRATSYHDGEMGGRARRAYQYYYGELPAPVTSGSSRYVDRTVWESVNGVLQDTLSVFTSGDDAVKFAPECIQDGFAAEAATNYCNRVLLRENDGYRVIHDTIKESLLTSAGFSKVYWEECEEEIEEEFVNVTMEELEALQADRDSIVRLVEEGEEKGTYSGELVRVVDHSGVRIEFVPFEHVLVDPTATSLEDANYVAVRTRKSVGELIDMGFDAEVVERGRYLSESKTLDDLNSIRQNGLNPDASATHSDITANDDELASRVYLYENYVRTSLLNTKKNKKNKVKLLQVFTLGNQILEVNEVCDIPLEICTPLPVPASIFGESVYDITKDIQDLMTSLTRGYIDNIMSANFGRYTALKNQYDRRSLLDNRPGGVVEINTMNAIALMPHHPLPVGIESILERTEQTKERRTGVTRIGMGLSPEVFKNDNAYATVNMMMSAAQNRMRMIARNIAKGYITNIMLHIYRLARENDNKIKMLEVMGEQVPINPSMWPERTKMITAVAIGANENRERAQNLMNLLTVGSTNPMVAGTTFSQQNANYLFQELVRAMGFNDVPNFATPMSKIPPPQPNPVQQLELAKLQAEIQDKQASAQEKATKAQVEIMRTEMDKMKSQMEQQQTQLEMQHKMMQMQFEQEKAADEMDARQAESESRQDEMADNMILRQQEMQLKEREMLLKEFEAKLKEQELQLKKQELYIEAQLEHSQGRPVGIGD